MAPKIKAMSKEKSFCSLIILLINLLAVDVKSLTISPEKAGSSSSSSSSPSSSSPYLSSCPNSCFCDQDNIYVSCVGDHSWDTILPDIPRTVIRLEIRNYNVSSKLSPTISPDYFTGMPSLRELKLQSLALVAIANNSFIGLSQLDRLDLSDNQLENLTSSTFSGLTTSLRYLDLSTNRLSSIDEAFLGCAAIEQLNLRNNRLTNLTINTFIGLVKLQYLNLDCNQIAAIELGSFLHLTRLGHLIISNNPISSVTRFDSMSTHLKFVDVSNISLTVIPHGIDPFIRDLRLAGNHIGGINSGDLDNYLYLNVLVLDGNGIEYIEPDSLGRLEYLIKLWLKDNRLSEIPIDLPTSLRQLYLDANYIKVLNATAVSQLTNLERFSLANNLISTIEPGSFRGFKSLIQLDLSGNKIETLYREIFSGAGNLELLDLSANPLKMISYQIFVDTPNLNQLHLARIASNNITNKSSLEQIDSSNLTCIYLNHLRLLNLESSPSIAEKFFTHLVDDNLSDGGGRSLISFSNLIEVNLIGAQLKLISLDRLKELPDLRTIKLDGNKWDCSENSTAIIKFAEWLNETRSEVVPSKSDLKCWSPIERRGKTIITLGEKYHLSDQTNTSSVSNKLASVDLLPSNQAERPVDKANDLRHVTINGNSVTSKELASDEVNSSHVEPMLTSNLPSGHFHLNKPSHDLFPTNGNISRQASLTSTLQSIDVDAGGKRISNSKNNSQQIGALRPMDSIKKLSMVKSSPSGRIIVNPVEAIKSTQGSTKSSQVLPNLPKNLPDKIPTTSPSSVTIPSTVDPVSNQAIALPMSSEESSSSGVKISETSKQLSVSSFSFHRSTSPPSSSSSLSPASQSSGNHHLVQFGIVSFLFGSLIIAGTLCFAVLTLIKSRKIYSTIGKENHGDAGSWLRRSVSYLSHNDEVSFVSLTEACDGRNQGSSFSANNDPFCIKENDAHQNSMLNQLHCQSTRWQ